MAKTKGFEGGSASSDHAACLAVLDEFVSEVENFESLMEFEKPFESIEDGWPDLWVTYLKARKLVRDE